MAGNFNEFKFFGIDTKNFRYASSRRKINIFRLLFFQDFILKLVIGIDGSKLVQWTKSNAKY